MRKKTQPVDLLAQFEQLSARTAARVFAVLDAERADEFKNIPRHLVQAIHSQAIDTVRKTLFTQQNAGNGHDDTVNTRGHQQMLELPNTPHYAQDGAAKTPRKKRIMKRVATEKQPHETQTSAPRPETTELFQGGDNQ